MIDIKRRNEMEKRCRTQHKPKCFGCGKIENTNGKMIMIARTRISHIPDLPVYDFFSHFLSFIR